MPETTWEKTVSYSKQGFDKVWQSFDKLGDPVNRLSYRIGAEAFWPMTLDKESDKAARILRSFCKDGFYADIDEEMPRVDIDGKINRPRGKQRVLKKIPTSVIKQAKGLAIFTTMRSGLWLSGAGGSGILLGRIPETGEWSPPSGILLHTAGFGLLAGVDIYDCVVVINTHKALEAFKTFRCTVGGEISASAGPFGVGGVLESEVHKRQAPIWTYMKSRGLYGGVQVDGTIILERADENERFYGERISVNGILAGKVRHPPYELRTLMNTIKAAQGDTDVDESLIISPGQSPSDMDIQPPGIRSFGIPDIDDPDPYGVKALEAEGLFIREAGTQVRPSYDTFEFRPSLDMQRRFTMSTRGTRDSARNSWRASLQSFTSVDRGTQTSEAVPAAPISASRASSLSNRAFDDRVEPSHWDDEEHQSAEARNNPYGSDHSITGDLEDTDPEVHEVTSATVSKRGSMINSVAGAQPNSPNDDKVQSPTLARARVVTIPKRGPPPPLPPRNPHRRDGSPSPSVSPVPSRYSARSQSVTSTSKHMAKDNFSERSFNHSSAENHSAISDSAVDTSYDKAVNSSEPSAVTDGFEAVSLEENRLSESVAEEPKTSDTAAVPDIERPEIPLQAQLAAS